MKHVGLNVAADPFMNSALVSIKGGLVVAVADDPGMHSSQNEQDSRVLADFARILCLEPSSQQEAYDMTVEAFELSERFHVPVLLRLVTRLAHSRAGVIPSARVGENPVTGNLDPATWILLPMNARKRWRRLLDVQPDMLEHSETSRFNRLDLSAGSRGLGVITTGLARNYYRENALDLGFRPSHLHIGAYPIPDSLVRELASQEDSLLVLEEGYPYVERYLRGIRPPAIPIQGKLTGEVPHDGELTPDIVRRALWLPTRSPSAVSEFKPPARLPQLCKGCPHRDAYAALHQALDGCESSLVTSDIGCYTLGAMRPISIGSSCVCMGASIGMAQGASEAGYHPAVAVIGDSTFLHSGITPLVDAAAVDADMTVLILDNQTVAMTGMQPTMLPSTRLRDVVLGVGVDPDHVHVVESHPKRIDEMAALLRREIAHRGLSVVIASRECIEAARKRKAAAR